MSWSGFWTWFLIASLAVYGVMAILVSLRGAGELVALIRRARQGESAADEASRALERAE